MIVYAGKQFWNDFNNGDEALFEDANRPRDNDKFKIKPWLQSDKWDFRSSNKNINTKASWLIAHWAISAPSGTAYYFPPNLQIDEKVWDPWCKISDDWKVLIVEDGTYIIQATCQFMFGSTPANWYQYIENVALLKQTESWWAIQARTQGRACANTSAHSDWLSTLYTWWIPKGTIFTVWASHSYSSNIILYEIINVHRLA